MFITLNCKEIIMLLLTNCLSKKHDEGCLKVANSLVKRLIASIENVFIVSYERDCEISNEHIKLNKLLISKKLFRLIKRKNDTVLYIPFPAREWATALRVFILSLMCKKKLVVVLTMLCRCNFIGRLLFKMSGATIVTFSENTKAVYENMVGSKRVQYLKTGVDTKLFLPVSEERRAELREKYAFSADKQIILHVGHMKSGRNIAELMKFNMNYQVILVESTLTVDEQDEWLKEELQKCENIRIIDEYLPDIEEIYQLSDLYFFPVVEKGNCIDVPLSCLEAAACNKPVLTTRYGEMATFEGKSGFWFIDRFDKDYLNQLAALALEEKDIASREQVLAYDWRYAISYFEGI